MLCHFIFSWMSRVGSHGTSLNLVAKYYWDWSTKGGISRVQSWVWSCLLSAAWQVLSKVLSVERPPDWQFVQGQKPHDILSLNNWFRQRRCWKIDKNNWLIDTSHCEFLEIIVWLECKWGHWKNKLLLNESNEHVLLLENENNRLRHETEKAAFCIPRQRRKVHLAQFVQLTNAQLCCSQLQMTFDSLWYLIFIE